MDERDYQAMNKDMESENIFKQAVDKFGVENQLLKLVEEMAELTQAIIKYKFEPSSQNFKNLIEEYVDVEIVKSQIDETELMYHAELIYLDFRVEKIHKLRQLLKTSEKTKVDN
jgi:NTP pyrophosphatase (non-canonical NTP hydrolase)